MYEQAILFMQNVSENIVDVYFIVAFVMFCIFMTENGLACELRICAPPQTKWDGGKWNDKITTNNIDYVDNDFVCE